MLIKEKAETVACPVLVIDYAKKGGVFREDAEVTRRFAPNVWRGCVRSV